MPVLPIVRMSPDLTWEMLPLAVMLTPCFDSFPSPESIAAESINANLPSCSTPQKSSSYLRYRVNTNREVLTANDLVVLDGDGNCNF